jgi:hypothetical protein
MGSGGIAPPFLTSTLDGGEWPVHALAASPPEKEVLVPIRLEDERAPEYT